MATLRSSIPMRVMKWSYRARLGIREFFSMVRVPLPFTPPPLVSPSLPPPPNCSAGRFIGPITGRPVSRGKNCLPRFIFLFFRLFISRRVIIYSNAKRLARVFLARRCHPPAQMGLVTLVPIEKSEFSLKFSNSTGASRGKSLPSCPPINPV